MTALNRVNALLNNRAAKLALTVIALGMIAVSSAQAVTLVTNLCALSGPGCAFTPTASVTGAPDDSTAVPTFNLTASPTFPGGVSVTGTFDFTADVAGLNLYSLELQLTGPTTGRPLGALGVTGLVGFDADPGVDSGIQGTLERFIVRQNGVDYENDFTTGPKANHVAGSALIYPLDPSAPVDQWTMIFDINWLGAGGSTLAIDFPLTENPSPEPVSVLLLGSGIGLLALLRRRRKA